MATTQTNVGFPSASVSPFSRFRKIGRSFVGSGLIALISVAALLALWEWLAVFFEVPTWLFPKPSDFLGRLVTDRAIIGMHALATGTTLLQGFLIGVLVAVPLALALTSIPALERGFYPIVVFLNIMLNPVIGPVLIIWFGIGPLVAAVIVFLMCFFPILVDAMAGFRSVDKRALRHLPHHGRDSVAELLEDPNASCNAAYLFGNENRRCQGGGRCNRR